LLARRLGPHPHRRAAGSRARPRHLQVDRRGARRHDRGAEPARARDDVHRDVAEASRGIIPPSSACHDLLKPAQARRDTVLETSSSGGDSMFEKLNPERRGGARRVLSSGALVLAAHVAIGAAAVWATLRPQVATGAELPPLVLPWPADPDQDQMPAAPGGMADPAPVPDLPTDPPIGLPPIDRGARFDATQWLHPGVAVGSASREEAGPLSSDVVDE